MHTCACVCVKMETVMVLEDLSAQPFERTAELRGALFKNVNYGNRSHKEFGSMQCILQVTVILNQVGMLIGTLLGTFKCVECTRDTAALMTDVSDNSAIAQVAHTDSKLGCF